MSSLSKKQSLASRSQRFRKKRQEGSKLTRDTTHRKNTRCWRGESLLVRVGEPWRRSDERLNWVLEKEYYILKGSWDGGRVSEDQRCWGTGSLQQAWTSRPAKRHQPPPSTSGGQFFAPSVAWNLTNSRATVWERRKEREKAESTLFTEPISSPLSECLLWSVRI